VIQISLGGSPISFQDEASGGLQRCAEEKCHAKHDNPRSKYAKAYLKYAKKYVSDCLLTKQKHLIHIFCSIS
ncbi:MAG: hypothetical protein MRZ65_10265, partial [Lachnospiraceae bacterium]|nr:hypothetical protein [Lachnospiraceae bacterium]